jgi:hypothetical protein
MYTPPPLATTSLLAPRTPPKTARPLAGLSADVGRAFWRMGRFFHGLPYKFEEPWDLQEPYEFEKTASSIDLTKKKSDPSEKKNRGAGARIFFPSFGTRFSFWRLTELGMAGLERFRSKLPRVGRGGRELYRATERRGLPGVAIDHGILMFSSKAGVLVRGPSGEEAFCRRASHQVGDSGHFFALLQKRERVDVVLKVDHGKEAFGRVF